MSEAVLEVSGLVKDYRGLRPLRLRELSIQPGEQVALLGFDQPAAEVFINLVTGATLPDEGRIRIFGRDTSEIRDSTEWLDVVDRFGIVSERAPLLESFSVLQNLAMPFSLEIDPMSDELRAQAASLGCAVHLGDALDRRIGDLEPAARLRARLGRALALKPEMVLFEHPSAALQRGEESRVGQELRKIVQESRPGPAGPPAALTLTADKDFALSIANRVLALEPATGRLTDQRRGWFFGRGTASL